MLFGKRLWKCFGNNYYQIMVIMTLLIFVGAVLGYFLLNEEIKILDNSFRESYKPIAVITYKSPIKFGIPKETGDQKIYKFNSELTLHNKGNGILSLIGAFTYSMIDTMNIDSDFLFDFRKHMLSGKIDTSKIGFDKMHYVERYKTITPEDSTIIIVDWEEIKYKPQPWILLYIIILYNDHRNELYDTIHLIATRIPEEVFDKDFLESDMIKLASYNSEIFHKYNNSEKEALRELLDHTGHSLVKFIK